jgi:hypothetical protein
MGAGGVGRHSNKLASTNKLASMPVRLDHQHPRSLPHFLTAQQFFSPCKTSVPNISQFENFFALIFARIHRSALV